MEEASAVNRAENAPSAPPPPRRFTGKKKAQPHDSDRQPPTATASSEVSTEVKTGMGASSGPKVVVRKQVPDEILLNADLNDAMKVLPANYNFEVHKTVWRIKQENAKRVALQFPEGLLMFACTLSDIFETFAGVEQCFILGDVAYGACCVDDFSAGALGADFLVHYGHSCLVPVDLTTLPTMYVFVDIQFDSKHLVDTIRHNFPAQTNIALAGTIQFSSTLHTIREELAVDYPSLMVPQAKPLSPGEVLGCTAPVLGKDGCKGDAVDAIVFVADGRFHLEAIMIANPSIPAYRYDPYLRVLTKEEYDNRGMRETRRKFIEQAYSARSWGVVLGTLGRQGNPNILKHVEGNLQSKGYAYTVILLSELTPAKIHSIAGVDAWVQIACPRLSIDWGEGFSKPVLTPYEAEVCLGGVKPWWHEEHTDVALTPYPMNYYMKDSGPWTSAYVRQRATASAGTVLPHRRKKATVTPTTVDVSEQVPPQGSCACAATKAPAPDGCCA
mmetsp:Transcript_33074/g.55386  ORF Transcript_33074/g.55386 Transcript_33074/m.55386 type:complete len:500 (+) Transcript_33074:329-1828(+)|eukprot:CAMPEP_0198199358 /NCGR_PEP_ID=MMETSP1445-20131203/2667_1 /TAXON_ID=36898 /ORGANISM="Pyramimonas sp., Strain CCMP2087" /LENGTH=499 /DNA_ID=CAMNT_0043869185 /DNA_START=304 /DNA_END=1803 /DNA_ORIENTATION=-